MPQQPKKAGLVVTALVLGALVANLNLAVANIALPDIGRAFDTGQTELNLIALGCTLGLAMSVLYLGALGDRYGRKLMLLLGLGLTIPASAISAWAPSADILIAGRIFTGIAAGLAFPTTLALITALWSEGPARVKAIALWSGVGGAGAVFGTVVAGALLEEFWWGSVFLIAVPPAIIAFFLVLLYVPAHVNESTEPVDNLGGVLSVFMIAALVLGLGTITAPGGFATAVLMLLASLAIGAVFVLRQRRASNPIYDLHYAARRLFWVAGLGGMIAFGSLMGAMFIGQQYLQNVLGYDTLDAGLAIIPGALGMMIASPPSAKLVASVGSRITMLLGTTSLFVAFLLMLIAWREETPYWQVGLAYLLVGIGAGLILTPASRALTGSVPVARVGMASATTDLQRDLGGSIMQALFGSLLTAGYAAAMASRVAESPESSQVTASTESVLQKSFSSAETLAQSYPQYSDAIEEAARQSFLDGANWAYAAGAFAVLLGAALIALRYPGKAGEQQLFTSYAQQDATSA